MTGSTDEVPLRTMPPHRLGTYFPFAQFRDASKDDVPVRTRPAAGRHPDSGWVETILDEAEWLARPDLWAVDLLSEEKRNLAEFYSIRWAADDSLTCPVCRPLIHLLWTETGFDPKPLDSLEWLTRPAEPNEKGTEFAARNGCICGTWSVIRTCRYWLRGIITQMEMLNKLVECVFMGVHRRPPADATLEQHEAFRVRCEQVWQYGRNLALDLCGPNPFRPVVYPDSWKSESAIALARTAYDTRNFTLMPILADALEEASCDHPEVLTHCRGPGPHLRGCWVVDGVLGNA